MKIITCDFCKKRPSEQKLNHMTKISYADGFGWLWSKEKEIDMCEECFENMRDYIATKS